MARWRIKEISDLTKISVRMLRHYDKMGLLIPSMRTSNGYRWYSEQDLATLQQIIALKFFGFELNHIKTMLQQKLDIRQQLQAQQQMLHEQAEYLSQAQDVLSAVIQRVRTSEILDWNDLILLIERYRMSAELKKTWAGRALNETQFAEYINIRQQHPREFETWEKLITQINEMKLGDPEGSEGERVIEALIDIMKKTKESLSQQLRFNSDVLQSIKEGRIVDLPLSPEGNVWMAKASLAYWLKRWEQMYQEIVNNLTADPTGAIGKKIAKAWRTLIDEQITGSSPDLVIGTMLWQEVARQKVELQQQTIPPLPQEMINKIHVDLLFNPAALSWIEKALNAYTAHVGLGEG